MKYKELGLGLSIPHHLYTGAITEILTPDLISLLAEACKNFGPTRQQLLSERKNRYQIWDKGELPNYLDQNSLAVTSNWKVAPIPTDLMQRRVEITGPVNDTKMVINMLSRNDEGARADTAMLDFEDSMKPSWPNIVNGIVNVIGACSGNLKAVKTDSQGKVLKEYALDPNDMAIPMVRVRGLHLDESNLLFENRPIHGGLFDLTVCFYHTYKILAARNQTPKYYIPKCEHHLEARWWNDLFCFLEDKLQVKRSTIRATFLIETLPAAFQIEEILYEIREHAAGLNVGRWDKIFSDIKVLKNHKDRISSDRALINMSCHWMDNYAKRLIKICHSHGAFAIGGMSAFTPGKDEVIRKEQTDKVFKDKKNEFDIGHDGCWVSHPYFIGHAMKAFTQKNQLDKKLDDFPKCPDLLMQGSNKQTMQGLCTNIRVGIAYLYGWGQNLGCVAWDNLMEDLATLEISRAQTWQWLHHKVKLVSGEVVDRDLIKKIFDQELQKIIEEVKATTSEKNWNQIEKDYEKASKEAFSLFTKDKLDDFLATSSDPA